MSARALLWFASAPLRAGISPVNSAARLGAQAGDATNALLNVTPAAASRSMFGVRTSFAPYTLESSWDWSSEIKTTMFGRLGAAVATAALPIIARNSIGKIRIDRCLVEKRGAC